MDPFLSCEERRWLDINSVTVDEQREEIKTVLYINILSSFPQGGCLYLETSCFCFNSFGTLIKNSLQFQNPQQNLTFWSTLTLFSPVCTWVLIYRLLWLAPDSCVALLVCLKKASNLHLACAFAATRWWVREVRNPVTYLLLQSCQLVNPFIASNASTQSTAHVNVWTALLCPHAL